MPTSTLTFDDLGSYEPVPSIYDGFAFGTDWYTYGQADYNTNYIDTVTVPSFPNFVYNGYGQSTVSFSSSESLIFGQR